MATGSIILLIATLVVVVSLYWGMMQQLGVQKIVQMLLAWAAILIVLTMVLRSFI